MNELQTATKPTRYVHAKEYKLQVLRDCPVPKEDALLDCPDRVDRYYRAHVVNHPYHNPDVESFVVLFVNSRRRVTGHQLVSTGTLDTLLVHPREVFKTAIVANAAGVILLHNHPSGDPTPSEADIRVTRDLVRAGQLLKIDVLDHVVIGEPREGKPGYTSLRELGYFTV